MMLEWYVADSADDLHDDEETDLTKVGMPGGAVWAYVANESNPDRWTWGVLDAWLWDDAEVLASGEAETKFAAQAAVQQWVVQKMKESLFRYEQ